MPIELTEIFTFIFDPIDNELYYKEFEKINNIPLLEKLLKNLLEDFYDEEDLHEIKLLIRMQKQNLYPREDPSISLIRTEISKDLIKYLSRQEKR